MLEHRRPAIVIFRGDKQECLIFDVEVPGDHHIIMKEKEMIVKYGDLRIEIPNMWQLREWNINKIYLHWHRNIGFNITHPEEISENFKHTMHSTCITKNRHCLELHTYCVQHCLRSLLGLDKKHEPPVDTIAWINTKMVLDAMRNLK